MFYFSKPGNACAVGGFFYQSDRFLFIGEYVQMIF